MTEKNKRTIVDLISILFIILFVYAAVSKWIDLPRFRVQVGQSPLLTDFVNWIIWIIPGTELTISSLLYFDQWRIIGLYASLSLMALFTSYIVVLTRFSDFVPCSCGGILQNMSWNQHLVFNILFMGLAMAGIFFQSTFHQKSKHLLQ